MTAAAMKRCSCGYLPLPDATHCPKCGAVVVRESAGFHWQTCDILIEERAQAGWYEPGEDE